jgi:flagellar hook-associated protein 2
MADSTISSTSSSAVSSLIQSQYQQPAISFSGLGSNIDTTSMINQLVKAESGQLNQLTTWRDQWTAKISALQTLNTKLSGLRTTIQGMDTLADFQSKTTSISDQSVLSATTSSGAASGNHQVLVNRLAQNEVQVQLGLAGSDTVVNASGNTQVFAFSYAGGNPVSIQVPDGTTLVGLAQLNQRQWRQPGDDGHGPGHGFVLYHGPLPPHAHWQ